MLHAPPPLRGSPSAPCRAESCPSSAVICASNPLSELRHGQTPRCGKDPHPSRSVHAQRAMYLARTNQLPRPASSRTITGIDGAHAKFPGSAPPVPSTPCQLHGASPRADKGFPYAPRPKPPAASHLLRAAPPESPSPPPAPTTPRGFSTVLEPQTSTPPEPPSTSPSPYLVLSRARVCHVACVDESENSHVIYIYIYTVGLYRYEIDRSHDKTGEA